MTGAAVPNPIPYVLTAYSLPHTLGYLSTRDGTLHPAPLSPLAFVDLAQELGLAGVEMPLSARVPSFDGKIANTADVPEDFGDLLRAHGLRVVADYGALLDHDADHLRAAIERAARFGATVMRVILSHILCGDRRKLVGGWEAHLNALAGRLREVLPYAQAQGICLALENHQDATTEDFLRLYEMTGQHPAFGVTLDTGNPLAVGEDPVEAARELAPLIRHLHCKDYTIHFAPEGYRLVRCANGDGVVDFPAILALVRDAGHDVLPGIEIAAQATRTIPILAPGWWAEYPSRPATELLPALQILWQQGRPQDEPYSSAWERGEDSAAVAAEEREVVRRSVAYFRGIPRAVWPGDDAP